MSVPDSSGKVWTLPYLLDGDGAYRGLRDVIAYAKENRYAFTIVRVDTLEQIEWRLSRPLHCETCGGSESVDIKCLDCQIDGSRDCGA